MDDQRIFPGMGRGLVRENNKHVGQAYVPGSETSQITAESMVEEAKNQREAVWNRLEEVDEKEGRTCQELEVDLGFSRSSCSSRVWELREMGRVRKLGVRRPTVSGRPAEAYVSIKRGYWVDDRPGWPNMKTLTRPQKLKRRIKYLEELLEWNGIDHD